MEKMTMRSSRFGRWPRSQIGEGTVAPHRGRKSHKAWLCSLDPLIPHLNPVCGPGPDPEKRALPPVSRVPIHQWVSLPSRSSLSGGSRSPALPDFDVSLPHPSPFSRCSREPGWGGVRAPSRSPFVCPLERPFPSSTGVKNLLL